MNIFFTSTNPKIAAINLNSPKLYQKMYIENFQMLCTTYRVRDIDAPYKSFNPAHESRMWLEESASNFRWLIRHTAAILDIYKELRGKLPKIKDQDPSYMFDFLLGNMDKLQLPETKCLTVPFLAMKNNAPDLVQKYGEPVELVSPVSGKTNTAWRGKDFTSATAAYKQFLMRKEYWQPEYKFISKLR